MAAKTLLNGLCHGRCGLPHGYNKNAINSIESEASLPSPNLDFRSLQMTFDGVAGVCGCEGHAEYGHCILAKGLLFRYQSFLQCHTTV